MTLRLNIGDWQLARGRSYLGQPTTFSSRIVSLCMRALAWAHPVAAIVGFADLLRTRASICPRPRQHRADLAQALHWLNLFS